MSQIWFEAKHKETPVKVLAGYDRPLQHYFVTVFLPDDSDGEEQLLFSSLDDPEATAGRGALGMSDLLGDCRLGPTPGNGRMGGYTTPEVVMEKLTTLGITIPQADAWLETIKKEEGTIRYRFSEEAQAYVSR